MCERHVGVHHSYAQLSAFNGCYGAVHRCSQRDVAVLVRQGNLHQGGPKLDYSAAVQCLALPQMHGQIVGVACVYVGTHVRPNEETLLREDAFILRL